MSHAPSEFLSEAENLLQVAKELHQVVEKMASQLSNFGLYSGRDLNVLDDDGLVVELQEKIVRPFFYAYDDKDTENTPYSLMIRRHTDGALYKEYTDLVEKFMPMIEAFDGSTEYAVTMNRIEEKYCFAWAEWRS